MSDGNAGTQSCMGMNATSFVINQMYTYKSLFVPLSVDNSGISLNVPGQTISYSKLGIDSSIINSTTTGSVYRKSLSGIKMDASMIKVKKTVIESQIQITVSNQDTQPIFIHL